MMAYSVGPIIKGQWSRWGGGGIWNIMSMKYESQGNRVSDVVKRGSHNLLFKYPVPCINDTGSNTPNLSVQLLKLNMILHPNSFNLTCYNAIVVRLWCRFTTRPKLPFAAWTRPSFIFRGCIQINGFVKICPMSWSCVYSENIIWNKV